MTRAHGFPRVILQGLLLAATLSLPTTLAAQSNDLPDYVIAEFGAPPAIPTGPLSPELQAAVKAAFIDSVAQAAWGEEQTAALQTIAQSGDPRLVWVISDLLRFITNRALTQNLAEAASSLLGKNMQVDNHWGVITDHLMAWDIPAPPDYLDVKRGIFTTIVPGWERIFVEGDIDWRFVSWGGVLIDDRPFDMTDEPCNCIPAADNPPVTNAEEDLVG